ncbi:hypothetical protein P691DRAFT_702678 [Macrolepiota fuliginosa MF-IS2]|uniref:Uncharacterized protein n=1 Tax=Macrolepiota fuliginosa MF-IS2 TaxID=1400762 RepID=A0A9P6C5W6_9AGAR|nr:hypothetical protein P691DRAFT_702678 [Macrolepiota fuliginosa MF-IS2]
MTTGAFLLLSLATLTYQAFGAQIPLHAEPRYPLATLNATWNFDSQPPVNATGHLTFLSVASLLQHWPNTLYRNGHTLVPGTIPPGTLLYHGTPVHEIPSGPNWVATDPEHANLFCRGTEEEGGWQLTLMAMRELNVLYFDGSSAAKMKTGTMDSQDLVIWGEVKPEWYFEESKRVKELCVWGAEKGLDGFVRMEMDFEIMLCDFNKGVQVASFLNLPASGPARIPVPSPPPHFETPHPNLPTDSPPPLSSSLGGPRGKQSTLVTESGSWHNHYPGESRIHLDLTRLISFYDVELFPSLIPSRIGKPRWEHRLEEISKGDVRRLYERLNDVLNPGGGRSIGSGVDWKALVRVIMNRYGKRLELLQYVLQGNLERGIGKKEPNVTAIAVEVHGYVAAMLAPYTIHTAVPPPNDSGKNLLWAAPIFRECSTVHTESIRTGLGSRLTRSERLILDSVQDTTKEICRVLVRVWAEGTAALRPDTKSEFNSRKSSPSSVLIGLGEIVKKWEEDVSGLMNWLAWDIWTTCRPACGFDELCYLPNWPYFLQDPALARPEPPPVDALPTPYCIPLLDPYA